LLHGTIVVRFVGNEVALWRCNVVVSERGETTTVDGVFVPFEKLHQQKKMHR
jgi:hypothetical protein